MPPRWGETVQRQWRQQSIAAVMSYTSNPPTSDSTSTSLLERIKSQDPQAWQALSRIYAPLVYSWCRSYGVCSEDAADIAQEVFGAVHRSIADFRRDRPHDSFRGWLWTITRNKIRDHFRGCADRAAASGGTDAQLLMQNLPEDAPLSDAASGSRWNSILLRGVETVQGEFEPRTWQAFWRTAVDDLSSREVADDLGMTPGAVRKAKFRVLRRLREVLDELVD